LGNKLCAPSIPRLLRYGWEAIALFEGGIDAEVT